MDELLKQALSEIDENMLKQLSEPRRQLILFMKEEANNFSIKREAKVKKPSP